MKQAPLRAFRCLPRLSTGISSGVWLMQSALPPGGGLNKTTRVPCSARSVANRSGPGPRAGFVVRTTCPQAKPEGALGPRGSAPIQLGSGGMARRALSPRFGWLFSMAALLATLIGLFWPAIAAYTPISASTAPDPVRITDYRAQFGVTSGGDLAAVEKITAQF